VLVQLLCVTATAEATSAGCRPLAGSSLDHMDAVGGWEVRRSENSVAGSLRAVPGTTGRALKLTYDLGTPPENPKAAKPWVQIRRDFASPVDISSFDHFRLRYRGTRRNSLEVGLVSDAGVNYFAHLSSVTHVPWWTYAIWDRRSFRDHPLPFPDVKLRAIFISVTPKENKDVGGAGSLTIDELENISVRSRHVSPHFQPPAARPAVAAQAAAWIGARQRPGGLLKSWQEETADLSHLYDQGLGLLVLSERNRGRADRLAAKLRGLQNANGSWFAGYHFKTGEPTERKKPVGAISWAVYALVRYYATAGTRTPAVLAARKSAARGAAWLASVQRPDGSVPAEGGESRGSPTEPNLDAWWAFHATDRDGAAKRLRHFLLNHVWDQQTGRFKASPDSFEIFLDAQTWGSAFLRANRRAVDARRALSYARSTLATTSSHQDLCGLDGGGPFSPWNEGTAQFASEGGPASAFYLAQLARQQAADGGIPGSPDAFRGYTVWLTRWHGVAPTAWTYFAATPKTGGPFRSTYRPPAAAGVLSAPP
jgi:hypothetical protein